jgi:hypothetical protein
VERVCAEFIDGSTTRLHKSYNEIQNAGTTQEVAAIVEPIAIYL